MWIVSIPVYDRKLHEPVKDARVSKPIPCLDSERAHCSYCVCCVYHPKCVNALLADLTEIAKVVLPSHRIVLVEGLHLLCDKDDWAKAYALFDRRILLEVIKWK